MNEDLNFWTVYRRETSMAEDLRGEIATNTKRLVVKVGTAVVTDEEGRLDSAQISALASDIAKVKRSGLEVVLVSSGAIGAGIAELGLPGRPSRLPQLQAAAAVGQSRLMRTYDAAFKRYGHPVGQLLLTRLDLHERVRYLNVRNTIRTLLDMHALPIINENDTTSVEELEGAFGDNDFLAALVTNLIRAELLVILTDVDGLYRTDPARRQPELIGLVEEVTDEVMRLAAGTRSRMGQGGMESKLQASRIVTSAGGAVVIANGRKPEMLARVVQGERVGTLFLPAPRKMTSWKRWIGFSARPKGTLLVDDGAKRALVDGGKSLLPSGVTDIQGNFSRGDVLSISDQGGGEFARGLANYSSQDMQRIKGLKSSHIAQVLGSCPYEELVHRDNMVVLSRPTEDTGC